MKLGFDKVKKYLLYNDGSKNVTKNYKIRNKTNKKYLHSTNMLRGDDTIT